MSGHIVEIDGPQGALRSIRRVTAGSLDIDGFMGKAVSPTAHVGAYHVSVVVRCQSDCPVMNDAEFTRCLQVQAFSDMTLAQATYCPTNPYAADRGGSSPQSTTTQSARPQSARPQ